MLLAEGGIVKRIVSTDSNMPPLSELLRGFDAFATLPNESPECLNLFRQGVIEIYEQGEKLAASNDLIAVCFGRFSHASLRDLSEGALIAPQEKFEDTAYIAEQLSIVFRLEALQMHSMDAICPQITASIRANETPPR
jgi:hypothetical protein